MLEKLNDIPWSKLLHAYGAADDVPDQIRDLASPIQKKREQAISQLYGNIFHQGTRYQATPYAVPFLYELLAEENTSDKEIIIYYLIHIALGYPEAYLPKGMDKEEFEWACREDEKAMTAAEREDCKTYGFSPQTEIYCYNAVEKGIPFLISLLSEDSPDIKLAIIYALAWFPKYATASISAIHPILQQSSDHTEIATSLLTIGLLCRNSTTAMTTLHLDSYLSNPSLIIRTTAAIALFGHPLENRVLEILIEAIIATKQLQEESQDISFNEGNLVGYISLILADCDDASREKVSLTLAQSLQYVHPFQSLDVTRSLLQLMYKNQPEIFRNVAKDKHQNIPIESLDNLSIKILTAIANDGGWKIGEASFGNYSSLVRSYGFPSSQKALMEYLALR